MKNLKVLLVSISIFCFIGASFGQTYQKGSNPSLGGYVIYVTPNGQHGLVVTYSPIGKGIWEEAHSMVSDPNLYMDWPGSVICRNFTDWRLPTPKELDMMSKESFILNQKKTCWSSVEYAKQPSQAVVLSDNYALYKTGMLSNVSQSLQNELRNDGIDYINLNVYNYEINKDFHKWQSAVWIPRTKAKTDLHYVWPIRSF